jgi:Protein of unknown function (DUF998)
MKATHISFTLTIARIALWSAVASVVTLAALHGLSPEFDPSLRMVSEYVLGEHSWAIALMFITWALGDLALVVAFIPLSRSLGSTIGLLLLTLAGVGALCGAIFGQPTDPRHGLAFALGVPTLPLAALLLNGTLRRNPQLAPWYTRLRWVAHLPWLSLVLMVVVVGIGLSNGGQFGQDVLVGWPNRLLVVAYNGWVGVVAWSLVQAILTNKNRNEREIYGT